MPHNVINTDLLKIIQRLAAYLGACMDREDVPMDLREIASDLDDDLDDVMCGLSLEPDAHEEATQDE